MNESTLLCSWAQDVLRTQSASSRLALARRGGTAYALGMLLLAAALGVGNRGDFSVLAVSSSGASRGMELSARVVPIGGTPGTGPAVISVEDSTVSSSRWRFSDLLVSALRVLPVPR